MQASPTTPHARGDARDPASTRPAGRVWMALLALGALALGLRLAGLDQQSLWVDEAFSYQYAKPDSPLPLADVFDNLHGPLHALLLHGWMKVAGHGEAALRLPSLIASLATVIVFWFYARGAWGIGRAWLAALLLAVAPFHVWYAQECRNYAQLILFAVLAEWAFHRLTAARASRGETLPAVEPVPPPSRAYAGYGLALLAGFLSNLSMAFFVLQHAVRLWITARPAPGVRSRILLTWALVALCLLPWAISFYEYQVRPSHLLSTEAVPEEARLREETTATPLGVPYTFYAFATGFSFGPATRELWQLGPWDAVRQNAWRIGLAAVVFGALWLGGIGALWRENRRAVCDLLIWQLLPLAILFFIALRNVKVINPRYVAVAYPAFVMTLAIGAADHRRRWLRAAWLLALAISLVSVGRGLMIEKYHKEDYRSAAAYLRETLRPGDAFVSLAVDLPLRQYYLREELRGGRTGGWQDLGRLVNWKGRIALKGRGPESYEEVLLAAWEPGRRLFVFLAREWVTDPGGVLERDLRGRGALIAERSWAGTRVLVLERRGDASGPRPAGE